jgi:hypothetical protein
MPSASALIVVAAAFSTSAIAVLANFLSNSPGMTLRLRQICCVAPVIIQLVR